MRHFIISFMLILIIASCGSSKITTVWNSSTDSIPPIKKIMVLALISDKDRSIREKMENHMVDDLKALGYHAASSLSELGPKAFENMDETKAIQQIKSAGTDAVLTIVLLDKEKERQFVQGNVSYIPSGSYYSRLWEYRRTRYQRIQDPGYYITDTKYFWETNLYNLSDERLLYSAQTRSFDPLNTEQMSHQYGKLLVKDMLKKNILQKR